MPWLPPGARRRRSDSFYDAYLPHYKEGGELPEGGQSDGQVGGCDPWGSAWGGLVMGGHVGEHKEPTSEGGG